MSKHAAILQNYNQELVKHIEHLRVQHDKLSVQMEQDEEERMKVEKQLEDLGKLLKSIELKITEKKKTQQTLKKTIDAAESGLTKIVESSEVLLSLVQRESEALKF